MMRFVLLVIAISALTAVTAWADLKVCGNGGCDCPVETFCASGKSKNNCAWCCESNKNCGWDNFLFHPPADACKSILVDNANCGTCGNVCPNGSNCEDGRCKVTPTGGYIAMSLMLSDHLVRTSVTSNGIVVLIIDFSTSSATAAPMLFNGTKTPTLDMPGLSGATIDRSIIGALNTVAKFITTQVINAVNANQGNNRRKLLDHPGCDFPGPPDTACSINCCAQHDKCYHDNGCTAASWVTNIVGVLNPNLYAVFPTTGRDRSCRNCNSIVANCIFASYALTCDECAQITPPGQSCYDAQCDTFFSCNGICPCYSTHDVRDNTCCSCPSPCQTPSPSPTPSPTTVTPPPTPSPTTVTPSPTLSPTPSPTTNTTTNTTANSCPGLSPPTCCAGETGTQCGTDCCCCPGCFAPGGPNCDCLPAAC